MSSVENYIPYQPNAQGLTEALIDLKSTMPSQTVFKVTGYKLHVSKMLIKVMHYIQELVMDR